MTTTHIPTSRQKLFSAKFVAKATIAAATALTAAGFLGAPAPAQAGPMLPLPLAPPCGQFVFNGDFPVQQANGWQVFFTSTGPTSVGGRAVEVSSTNEKIIGTVSGGIQGRNIDFTIRWDNHPSQHYFGAVNDAALVQGNSIDQSNGNMVGWHSTRPLDCSTPAAPPAGTAITPVPKGPLNPFPAPSGTAFDATVTSDVDVYDVPGGTGTKIGILRAGRHVQFAGDGGLPAAPGQTCKPNDWCHVVIPELPGGSGWVWDQFLLF